MVLGGVFFCLVLVIIPTFVYQLLKLNHVVFLFG